MNKIHIQGWGIAHFTHHWQMDFLAWQVNIRGNIFKTKLKNKKQKRRKNINFYFIYTY